MRDKELTLEVLRQIEDAAVKIVTRFQAIRQVSVLPTVPPGLKKWMPSA